ncbi:MAG: tetratricopeptide repeat protein, partial [Myxococcales bacterium]|nr:tetratricopeptide repeat protein [Myxococcales bacterium]
ARLAAAARAAVAAGDPDGALARYQDATTAGASTAIVAEHVALLERLGRTDDAVAVAAAHHRAHDERLDAALLHGEALLAAGDADGAARLATRLFAHAPTAAVAALRGAALVQAGELDAGLAAARAALAIDPRDARALRTVATAQRTQGDLDAAAAALDAGLAAAPRDAGLWLERALLANLRGDAATAMASAQRATTFAPDDGTAWYVLGELHRLAGATDDAHAAYGRSLASPRPHPKAALGVARLAIAAGALAEGEALLRQELAVRPDDATLLREDGAAQVALGHDAAALATLTRYLEVAPADAGDRDETRATIDALASRLAEAAARRADVAAAVDGARAARPRDAERAWQAVLALDADYAEARYQVALARARAGQLTIALDHLARLGARVDVDVDADAAGWLARAADEPAFVDLAADPRFGALLATVGR